MCIWFYLFIGLLVVIVIYGISTIVIFNITEQYDSKGILDTLLAIIQ